jgi:hypothetical protein
MNDPLRKCPTCGGTDGHAGLREYATWLDLPGRVSLTDIDGVLDHDGSKRRLILEFKRGNEKLGTGQRIALRNLAVEPGNDVWLVREHDDGRVTVADMAFVGVIDEMTREEFARRVSDWWDAETLRAEVMRDARDDSRKHGGR